MNSMLLWIVDLIVMLRSACASRGNVTNVYISNSFNDNSDDRSDSPKNGKKKPHE